MWTYLNYWTGSQGYSLVNIFRQNLTSSKGLVNTFNIWPVHKVITLWTCLNVWTCSGKIWQVHNCVVQAKLWCSGKIWQVNKAYSLVNTFKIWQVHNYSLVNTFKIWQVHNSLVNTLKIWQVHKAISKVHKVMALWTFSGKLWKIHKAIAYWTHSKFDKFTPKFDKFTRL